MLVAGACGPKSSAPEVTELIPTIPPSDPAVVTDPPNTSRPATASTQEPDGGSDGGSNGGSDGGSQSTKPPKTTAAPVTTEAPTTTVKQRRLYELLPAPGLPTDHTPPFPKSGPLPDGTYWVVLNGFAEPATDGSPAADVTLFQAYFGDACVAKAASLGEECTNDLYVPASPTRRIASVTFKSDVTITVANGETQKHYYVTPAELAKLLADGSTSRSPKGYAYTPFAYLMRIRSGKIARFRQVWTP